MQLSDLCESGDLSVIELDLKMRRHRVILALKNNSIVVTDAQLAALADVDEALRRAISHVEAAVMHARKLKEVPAEESPAEGWKSE